MARTSVQITRAVSADDQVFLRKMSTDDGLDERTRKHAGVLLAVIGGESIKAAATAHGVGADTVRKIILRFNAGGWAALLPVLSPRGGDFLSRYDHGYWAERLVRVYLDGSATHRAIPYGTSRSEPFEDLETFRKYAIDEFLLQAWSAGARWKRPDLLCIPRTVLRASKGNDAWTPDLQHLDNEHCREFVEHASAAIEVETSLWQARIATVPLSFTVKDEDLGSLRSWVRATKIPLYILQVFYDSAYVLPFGQLEYLIGPKAPRELRVTPEKDRFTKKLTYRIPLSHGVLLGAVPEPEVEGRVYKASNGRVTVYGRLTGSRIEVDDAANREALASGQLGRTS